MTSVRIGLLAPTSDGTGRRPTGTLEWRPTMRRDVAGDVVLPAPFTVGLADPPPVIEVAPTEPGWAWAVVERVQGGSAHKRLLLVPDVGTVVDYADLVEVDPATLDPVTLTSAWWTQVTDYVATHGGGAVDSVNGQAGTVVLDAADVGAQPVGDYATNTALTTGLAGKVNSSTYTAGLAGKQDTATLGATVAADATVRATLGTFHNVKAILGTDSSQWPGQLEAAFAAYPGETFLFPDGQYGLNRGITVAHNNSLILAPGARIYATAATSILVNYETSDVIGSDFHALPQGKIISGGWLDGAGLADTVLRCAVFQGLKVENIRITDGIHRGLVVDKNKLGTSAPNMTAEGIFRGLHLMQTTGSFITDNVAVEVIASDCHFEDIVVIDWTTAVRDLGSGLWQNVHAWISQPARYPTSVCFDVQSSPRMDNAYSDTYRTGWKVAANSGPTLKGPVFYISPAFVDGATNAANPATIFALADASSSVYVRGGNLRNYQGATGSAQATFVTNPSANTNIDGIEIGNYADAQTLTPGAPGSYYRGRLLGRNADFSPTIVGATTAGSASYGQQTGWRTDDRNAVRITMQVYGTFDATIAGNLQIPLPIAPTLACVARIGAMSGLPPQTIARVSPNTNYLELYDQSTASLAGGGSAPITGAQVQGKTFYIELDVELNVAYFTGNGSD